MENIKQLVPSEVCLKCDICCRYPEKNTPFVPCFFADEAERISAEEPSFSHIGNAVDLKGFPLPLRHRYICRFFTAETNGCRIYGLRPFDCRLYPFMVTYDKDYKSVVLAVHADCPFVKEKLGSEELKNYADYLACILESEEAVEKINANKCFINDFQEGSIVAKRLENLSRRVCLSGTGLKRISLNDKPIFGEYFKKISCMLSSFSFAPIYIWSGVLNILWTEIDGSLCVFAGNDRDYFMIIPPISEKPGKGAIDKCRDILSRLNSGREFPSKIENVPQELLEDMRSAGLRLENASDEYIYIREELAALSGSKLKAKRALVNSFVKNYEYNFRQLTGNDAFKCLELYSEWAKHRLDKNLDDYYRFLIEDSYFAQKLALLNLKALGLKGYAVEIGGDIKAYSVGFPLDKDAFVILFETADLNIKGLSQFMFMEFTGKLFGYKYINTLSDAALPNLKKVKDSYGPIKKAAAYTAFF